MHFKAISNLELGTHISRIQFSFAIVFMGNCINSLSMSYLYVGVKLFFGALNQYGGSAYIKSYWPLGKFLTILVFGSLGIGFYYIDLVSIVLQDILLSLCVCIYGMN